MIDVIYRDEALSTITVGTIEEEGVEVKIGDSLLTEGGDLDHDNVAILKLDDYYSTARMVNPPKAIDNLVVVCDEDGHHFYLIELKSAGRVRNINRSDIIEKFSTAVDKFLKDDFKDVFDEGVNVRSFCLWLVCDPFRLRGRGISQEEYDRKIRSCGLDAFTSMKPLSFNGKLALVAPMLPPPTIEKTHYSTALICS